MNFEWLEWKFVKTGTEFKKSNTFSLIGDFETSQFYPVDSRPIPCESLGQVTSVITWSTKFSSAVLIKEQHFEVLVEPWERTMGSNYFWIHILKYSHPCFCKRFFFPFHDWLKALRDISLKRRMLIQKEFYHIVVPSIALSRDYSKTAFQSYFREIIRKLSASD